MDTSPIKELLSHNLPHVWGKILSNLDGNSFQAFRSSCLDFYEIAEFCLQDLHLGLKARLHFEMSQFTTIPVHFLPQVPNPLKLPTWVTTFAKDGNDVFLGLMTGDSDGGFVYHLDLTTNRCRSCSSRFRGAVVNIQCTSDQIAIVYEEKFNPHYDYTDRKMALYRRHPELQAIPGNMPYFTCNSKLCVVGDAFLFFQSPSKNGGILINRFERDIFKPVMEFLGDQDSLVRSAHTKTHVLFHTSKTLSMVRFYRSSHKTLWTKALRPDKAKITMVSLSDELVVVERVTASSNTKGYLVMSPHTGDVIREYKHTLMGDWVFAKKRILKGTFEVVTLYNNSQKRVALVDWATQHVVPISIEDLCTWDVLRHGIRITLGDGRILWINRNDLKTQMEFDVRQHYEPMLLDTKVEQLLDQSHLAFVHRLYHLSGVVVVQKLTKGFLKLCGNGSID